MKKIVIEIEVDNDFEPCTGDCTMSCPFGYEDDYYCCVHLCRSGDGYGWSCPVKEAIEKGKKDE